MPHLPLRSWLPGSLLGLVLTLLLTLEASGACGGDNRSDFCSANFGLVGDVSAVAGRAASASTSLEMPRLPSAGALMYEDYKAIEAQARPLLKSAKDFRESISPHREKPNFDQLIQRFDYNAGFNRQVPNSAMTLQQQIDKADRDLRQARDLYAFLAVFAPEARFRADSAYANLTEPDPENPSQTYRICPAQRRADDPLSGQADWCNFASRMRQAVREAAYLRMIFGQQFTVDALGLHFSALDIVGGEDFVRSEVRKLQMAVTQFVEAETAVSEGLSIALGNGCLVSDFYTQAEWALLSRAAEGKHLAQHHIAVRLSYLDADGPVKAEGAYRGAGQEAYIKLVGTAGQAVRVSGSTRCAAPDALQPDGRLADGSRPDGTMLAEMVAHVLDTRNEARTLREGRNIFGFDVRFTPARPYRTSFGSDDTGLLNEAKSANANALDLWSREVDATREYDRKLDRLRDELTELNRTEEYDIQAAAGCDRSAFGTDAEYFACIEGTEDSEQTATDLDDGMIANTAECNPTVPPQSEPGGPTPGPTPVGQDAFEACMNRTTDGQPPRLDGSNLLILVSTVRQSRQELRASYLAINRIQVQMRQIQDRVNAEDLRNVTVRTVIFQNAQEQAVYAFMEEMANCCSVTATFGTSGIESSVTGNAGAPIAGAMRSTSIMRQAAADMAIGDAEKEAVIRNLFLDYIELFADLQVAVQEFQAKITQYNGVIAQLQHDVNETKRQRAWLQASPANDPSYRLVRDSARLALARQLNYTARVAYLAARRAEYEYAGRLAPNSVRISDIYKARTAEDIRTFLTRLEGATNGLIVADAEINQEDFQLSVAKHVVGLTDQRLGLTGAAAETERVRQFRQWVAQKTRQGTDGQLVLDFTFSTSLVSNGIFGQVIQQGYDRFWLHKLAGIGQPKPGNTGLGLNLRTAQTGGLGYRRVSITQGGLTHLRTRAGCIFDYRLIHPAALAGQEWPAGQPAESANAIFRAGINGVNGTRTAGFLGRPLSATQWQVEVFAGAPEVGLPGLDLQQLTDIELTLSTTFASRQPGTPADRDCVRVDFKADAADEGGK